MNDGLITGMKLLFCLALAVHPLRGFVLLEGELATPFRLANSPGGATMSSAAVHMSEVSVPADASSQHVTNVLRTCLKACAALRPLVKEIYLQLGVHGKNADNVGIKDDSTVVTLADGIVQGMLLIVLGGKLASIVGEEDDSLLQLSAPPYRAGGIPAPPSLTPLIEACRDEMERLHLSVPDSHGLTAFIDPIDGTREFTKGQGEQCTICIGLANDKGAAMGGLVYRPLDDPATWALGCAAEGVAESSLRQTVHATGKRGLFLTSQSRVSPFVSNLMAELDTPRLATGGCGNKMLLLLEGEGSCYIQDRGLSRWDTCAAEAVLVAHGGALIKLAPLLDENECVRASAEGERYTYVQSETNADYVPGLASLTKYNSYPDVLEALSAGHKVKATCIQQLKPYANTCGLLALPRAGMPLLHSVYGKAIQRAAAKSPPAFD